MSATRAILGMLCGTIVVMTGCTSYYEVKDPAGAKVYYTTHIDKTKAGAITFEDEKTDSVVTLQSSEIKEISEEQFNTAVRAPDSGAGQ